MCGIAGIFALDPSRAASRDELQRMIATMPYRGPDARGTICCAPHMGLGHVRLSILDLRPESNQPFELDNGDYVISYNGEIFNYIELRAELEAAGHSFRTSSDTEVLLRAYQAWGPAAVQRFNGMWAFAIYDRRQDLLFCSRDRFGVKPFVYAIDQGRVLIASEAKALLAIAPHLARPNYDSLSRLLRASIGARLEATCFAGIRRLLPAHHLLVSRAGVRTERYWNYPTDRDDSLSFEDAAEGLREQLVDALRLRMRSDVPVGITLSGGVDSSSIACLVHKFHPAPLDTFTASFPGEPFDEAPRAEALANQLGMRPHLVSARSDDFLATLRQVVRHLEAPIHTPAVLPLWFIMRAAKERVTVVLEGQGVDELLAGYYTNFALAAADRALQGNLLDAAREIGWELRRVGAKRAVLLAGRALGPEWSHRLFRRSRGDEQVYLGPLRDGPQDEPAGPAAIGGGRLNASLVRQHAGRLVDLLHYGDAISMAHSIESRLPFLDYRLVEYCCRMPGDFKYRDGHGKAVLKQAMRQIVPAEVLTPRKKLGFVVPIGRWFREQPERTVDPVLRSATCRRRGLFDPDRLDRALALHASGRADLSNNIYRWIITELWFQEFIDR